MNDERIQALATATRIASATLTRPVQAALQASHLRVLNVMDRPATTDAASARLGGL